jgi:hypothetical protein
MIGWKVGDDVTGLITWDWGDDGMMDGGMPGYMREAERGERMLASKGQQTQTPAHSPSSSTQA